MDESDAIEALEELGLSNYEAKVFVALQRLGTGTARDIHQATDVPRSQVYGAAESLQEQGLVEVQQSKPLQYRPVGLEEARSHLRNRFERTEEQAFDYLETARQEGSEDEQREDVWTIHGHGGVASRVEQLVDEAEERIVFGSRDPLVTPGIVEGLRRRFDAGVSVVVISEDEAVHERFDDIPVVDPPDAPDESHAGRVLSVDDDTVLISVLDDSDRETAIWSSQTGFASVLGQFIDARLDDAER
ncbi:TrmB family transcriptional regulator [Halomicrococcus sp. SG-WS-1]|uniref:TrmB family transcriptional regulator n=1 Tax=Halomicrococcus sp. SG-WS-1 TaxID=3439057 RepID=UPI003F7A8285